MKEVWILQMISCEGGYILEVCSDEVKAKKAFQRNHKKLVAHLKHLFPKNSKRYQLGKKDIEAQEKATFDTPADTCQEHVVVSVWKVD